MAAALAVGVASGTPQRRAAWVEAQGVTTLQCLGISPWLSMERLLSMLDECGFRGSFNYIHIPRNSDGEGRGFAFINMTSVSEAARLVEAWHGQPLPGTENGRRKVRFAPAKKQGYVACQQQMHKYSRVTNHMLRPLVTTSDGMHIIMAAPEVLTAWTTNRNLNAL